MLLLRAVNEVIHANDFTEPMTLSKGCLSDGFQSKKLMQRSRRENSDERDEHTRPYPFWKDSTAALKKLSNV